MEDVLFCANIGMFWYFKPLGHVVLSVIYICVLDMNVLGFGRYV